MENQTPIEYCQQQITHFERKASHNKREALWCFKFIMVGTLLAPLLVTLGTEFWLSKVLPSVLSVFAAFCTAWLQLRKPQELWSLYRTTQRELEDHLTKFQHAVNEYEGAVNKEKLLVENVAKLSIQAHRNWVSLVPVPDSLLKNEKEPQRDSS